MKTIQRAFDYVIYGLEWTALYFFRDFSTGMIFGAMYLGFIWFTAGLLVIIFGQERAIAFITNHPYLFIFVACVVILATGGLAFFAWTRDRETMDADLRRRLAKHNPLFRVA